MKKVLLLSLVLPAMALFAGGATAQIYKTTDPDGNVVFTDTPPPAGVSNEQVQLQHTNSTPPPPAAPAVTGESKTEEVAPPKLTVAIVSPTPETTVPMGPGNFSVTANVVPALEKGHSLQLLIDSEPQGELQQSGFWDLTNVFRGTHDLVVSVVNADGDVVAMSEAVRVHVMRPSVN